MITPPAEQIWSGLPLTPGEDVLLFDITRGKKLVAGRDYQIIGYENNQEVGNRATIKVIFKGNYTGSTEIFFTIAPISANSAQWKLENFLPTLRYTGQPLEQPQAQLYVNGRLLVLGEDYEICLLYTSCMLQDKRLWSSRTTRQ